MTSTITADQMRSKLLPLDAVRAALSATEPLSTHAFTVGDQVRFVVAPGWQAGIDAKEGTDLVDAVVVLGSGPAAHEFRLSKDALLEATSIIGLSKVYAARCPAELVEGQLNYWWRAGLADRRLATRDYQLLVAADVGAAITRASITPFSNLRLLEQALDGIEARYGMGEVLVDYKFVHSLRRTHLRLIVPDYMRAITGTGTEDDTWSIGIQVKNSLTGDEKTSIEGYLFRWWCTNGATDTRANSGAWTRRGSGSEAEVYEWARATVDEVLGGLEPALDAVQALVDIPVEGEATEVLRDVFTHYRVPLPERTRIIENMLDSGGGLTMYSIMAAITQVANDAEIDPGHVDNLLRMGGDLPHAAASRCGSCLRMMPH
jgi:hypothetical protein